MVTTTTTTTPGGQRVSICTCTRTGRHLATFSRPLGSSLYTLATEPPQVAASAQVSASGQEAASCSCRLLSHQTLLWHHRLGHPSLPCLRGMHSRLLVSSLPRPLPLLPPSPAPPCLPCVEGQQRSAPHSSSFPPTTAPVKTLHMDAWGPARVSGQGRECYFLLVVDDYTHYTMVFPLRSKGEVPDVSLPWIRAVCLQLRERFRQDLPVLRLHSDRGGESPPTSCGTFLFAVRYAAQQLNPWPRISLPETSPTLRWTRKVGDASVLRIWGSRAFVRDTSVDKLSALAIPCGFLGFVPDAPGWQFYHTTSRRVLPSQELVDESVPFYRLFPYRSAPLPPPSLFLAPCPPLVDPLPPLGPSPSFVFQVDPPPGAVPGEVAVDSGAARGTTSRGAQPGGAVHGGVKIGGAEPGGFETGGAEPGGAETEGVEPGGAASEGAESGGAEPQGAASSGGSTGASSRLSLQQLREWFVRRARLRSGATGAGGTGAGGARVAAGAGVTGGTSASGPEGARTRGTGVAGTGGGGGGGAGDPTEYGAAGAGGSGAGGTGAGGPGVGGTGAGGARVGGTGAEGAGAGGAGAVDPGGAVRPRPYFVPLLLQFGGLTERREPASRSVSAVRTARHVPRSRPPPVPGTHAMALRPSSVPLRVPLPPPPESSLPEVSDPDLLRLPSLLAPEGDPDAPDIPTPRSYAEAIIGPYSSQWQAAMDAEMASWKSTGTYVDEVPPPGANIVDGMWIFRVKRPPGSPPAFKARYFARGFSQRQGVDYFQTFSPTPKMTILQVLLHVAAQRDYELNSLDFSTTFLQGSLHEEIWLRRPPGFSGSFPAGTHWSLRRPVYSLHQAPRELHDTLRSTLAALGFAPSTADPSLFLRSDTSLPPFYIFMYIDSLIFATADTEALTLVKSELQKRHTCTDLGELRSYLGLQITRDRARRTITLTQSHMVHQVLQRFGFQFS
ncbi:unnamed protein product [Closterium sp. NIES-53]